MNILLGGDTQDSQDFAKTAILTPLNETMFEINKLCYDRFEGHVLGRKDDEGKIHPFRSYDTVGPEDNASLYQTEFLNELTPSGVAPHELWLKVGVTIFFTTQ